MPTTTLFTTVSHAVVLHTSVAADSGPTVGVGIVIAVLGAVSLAFGAHLQQAGVTLSAEPDARGTITARIHRVLRLIRRPTWMLGTVLLAVAVPLQLGALSLSPLVVVQPIGVVALLVSAMLEKRSTHRRTRLTRRVGVLACVGGVAAFVAIAARNADQPAVGYADLHLMLIVAVAVLVAMATSAVLTRTSTPAVVSVALAGVCYGTVATLAKVIISLLTTDGLSPRLIPCFVLLLIALALGIHFVHRGYASGPASLVVAGLTVIDPLVAVGAGALLLHEMRPLAAVDAVVMLAATGIAIAGVLVLARTADGSANQQDHQDGAANQQDHPSGVADSRHHPDMLKADAPPHGRVRQAPSR